MNNEIKLITPSEAVEFAKRGIKKFELERDPSIAFALRMGKASIPFLVKRLDVPTESYYLIPWNTMEGTILVVNIDAKSGKIQSASPFSKPISNYILPPDAALIIASQKFPARKYRDPKLVWCPCRESTNPLNPFYRITSKEGTVFVDMKGSLFTSLTPLGLGG